MIAEQADQQEKDKESKGDPSGDHNSGPLADVEAPSGEQVEKLEADPAQSNICTDPLVSETPAEGATDAAQPDNECDTANAAQESAIESKEVIEAEKSDKIIKEGKTSSGEAQVFDEGEPSPDEKANNAVVENKEGEVDIVKEGDEKGMEESQGENIGGNEKTGDTAGVEEALEPVMESDENPPTEENVSDKEKAAAELPEKEKDETEESPVGVERVLTALTEDERGTSIYVV